MLRSDSRSPILVFAFGAMALAIALEAAHALVGLGGASLDAFVSDGLYTGIEIVAVGVCCARVLLRREDRLAWLLIAAAVLTWTAGDLAWTIWLGNLASPPSPSIGDGLYLMMYPALYAGLSLMMRAQFRRVGAAMWLDGIVVGLTIAALGAGLVLPAVLSASSGGAAHVAVDLAYPLGDCVLLVFIAMGFAVSGWRPGRQWLLLGLGIAVSACADMIYLYQEAHGSYVEGRILDVMWPVSMTLIALAAWQSSSSVAPRNLIGRHTVILPAAFGVVALGLLVSATIHPLTGLAVGLATGAMLGAGARAALTYIENVRMLDRETSNAVTDALTGLGNRRRLMDDLAAAIARGADGHQATLAFFDLDGFKRYNDSFGHSAGDALLLRLGGELATVASDHGAAYRLGGDEFCVLLDGRLERDGEVIAAAQDALAEHGTGFVVTASCGVVVVPDEARSVGDALNMADERMYADKTDGHGSSRSRAQTVLMQEGVLMQLLTEREPTLRDHVCDVGLLAVGIGRRFGLNSEQLDELRRAAELHDLGKLAVPDQILNKPGRLSESEWRLMRQHTLIGERILNVAPALRPVGRLVRSSHERWDGGGYPDGLAGERIPLGSRIIAACDAYDAIVSERPYDGARTPAEALEELRRHAGTQFDREVVQVLCDHLQAGGAPTADRPPKADPAPQVEDPPNADRHPRADPAPQADGAAKAAGERRLLRRAR